MGSTHDGEGEAFFIARQVTGDCRPAVAAIVRPPQPLRTEVDSSGGVGAHQDRCVPVEAFGVLALVRLRHNVHHFAGGEIDPCQCSLLALTIHDVRIARLGGRLMTVPVQNHSPVGILNSLCVVGPRGAAFGAVVLCAAVYVVERFGVIHSHLIELCDGEIFDKAPVLCQIEALIHAAVSADEEVIRVVRTESDGVIVGMLVFFRHAPEGLAAVVGDLYADIHEVKSIELMRRSVQLLIVVRPRGSGDCV